MNVILGGGLAGLSCSYHLGHEKCRILEAKSHAFGHIHSTVREGFTWDEGPHVSFTSSQYVRDLFAKNVREGFEEYSVRVRNFFGGHWIDHPAQSNLYQIPEPLRQQCLDSLIEARKNQPDHLQNYQQWIDYAFGKVFAREFPMPYTEKYWTVSPEKLGIDWIGARVFFPTIEEVCAGASGPLDRSTHYISKVRYPTRGGYQSFAEFMLPGAEIELSTHIIGVSLRNKIVKYRNSEGAAEVIPYDHLIVTIPLPQFVHICEEANDYVKEAAEQLRCTQVTLVNVTAPHPPLIDGNWFYVYDRDKLAVRIHLTERLSPNNAPSGCTGLQVEVYHSPWKPLSISGIELELRIKKELVEMGFIDPARCSSGWGDIRSHSVNVPWANVVFDHERRAALETIWRFFEPFGLVRESDDLEPFTDWSSEQPGAKAGPLMFAGRFGQWRYFWSDDCVLRGKQISSMM
ncbi:MAG: NAD(P)/FAD-dependent oxidoreductase [Candidatus Methylacidiphilales bacterium]